jgi:hypothetical protein
MITTYSQLRTEVAGTAGASWTHRQDVLQKFDTCLSLAEEMIYTGVDDVDGLRIRDMQTTDTATLSTSVRTLALPTDFLEFRKLNLEYGNAIYPPLKYRTPNELEVWSSAGHPCTYTVTSQIEFDRVADVAYTINRIYYAKLTAVSSSNASNAILTRFPSVYLFGCLSQAFIWGSNKEKAFEHLSYFKEALRRANDQDNWSVGPSPQMTYQGSVV